MYVISYPTLVISFFLSSADEWVYILKQEESARERALCQLTECF